MNICIVCEKEGVCVCVCTCMCVHHREKYIKMAEAYEVLPVNLAPPILPSASPE